jgi:hypothetical protein
MEENYYIIMVDLNNKKNYRNHKNKRRLNNIIYLVIKDVALMVPNYFIK